MDLLAPQPSLFPAKPQAAAPAAGATRPGPDHHPVFFAVLPPPGLEPELRRALDATRRWDVGATLGAPETRRISLVALGFAQLLSAADRAAAEAAAASLRHAAFTLRFDRVASFRAKPGNKHPLVLLPADPAPLDALTTALRSAIIAHGLVPQRPPARFHLTLCYDRADLRARPIDPVEMPVDRFTLVRSIYGETRYEHWGEWRLG
jgi:2'-5' RNA ligase